jgi:4-aminobutyrate aminotransferase-like enzyme
MFAIEHYGVEPDIMCMAKGIADGFPLGAFITRPDIADAFTPGDHLSTFGGNPVSCAAASANVDVMQDEQLPQRAESTGSLMMALLEKVKHENALVGDVRGKGLMIGIELVADKNKTPAPDKAKQVRALCRENGVLVGQGGTFNNVIRLQPPLVLSETQAEQAVVVLANALQQVARA